MSEKTKKIERCAVIILTVLLILFTLVYSFFMVIMTGAGLVYNRESYGQNIMHIGILFIISGILMTSGTVICFFRKKILNIISIILSCSGFILCMIMLFFLVKYADNNGWSDNFTLMPISDMYKSRIMPVVIPFILSALTAIRNYFSHE